MGRAGLRRHATDLCIGVVVEPGPLPLWVRRCVDGLASEPGVRPAVVVRHDRPAPRRIASSAWVRIERLVTRRSVAPRRTRASLPVEGLPVISAADAAGAPDLDVLLDLPGSVGVTAAAPVPWPHHGVWRFGFGPEMLPAAGPAAAADLVDGRPTATIRLLADTADGRTTVLRQGIIQTVAHSWTAHRDRLLLRAADWPVLACRDLRAGRVAADVARPVPAASRCRRRVARLVWRVAVNRLTRALRFLRDDQWHIGVVDTPIASFLRPDHLPAPRWLPEPPPDAFYADPFPFAGGRSVVFERCSLRDRIGILCTLDLEAPDQPQPLATPGHHIAYPFVLEHGGQTYCTPETAAAGEVGLYGLTGDPARLDKVATLVEGVAAVDPTVTFHDGRWWLFFTDGSRDVDADLHIWYADDLPGPWAPHARNPVKVDVRSARPAGTPFTAGGALHRPAMDNSATYGARVVINRVLQLTPDEFQERTVAVVPPFPGAFGRGIHTLAAAGTVTIVDGKRVRTVPATLPAKLIHRLRAGVGPRV